MRVVKIVRRARRAHPEGIVSQLGKVVVIVPLPAVAVDGGVVARGRDRLAERGGAGRDVLAGHLRRAHRVAGGDGALVDVLPVEHERHVDLVIARRVHEPLRLLGRLLGRDRLREEVQPHAQPRRARPGHVLAEAVVFDDAALAVAPVARADDREGDAGIRDGLPVDVLLERGHVDALQHAVGRAGVGHAAVRPGGEIGRRNVEPVHASGRGDPRRAGAGVHLDLADVQLAHGAARERERHRRGQQHGQRAAEWKIEFFM